MKTNGTVAQLLSMTQLESFTHGIKYDGEEDECHFDITADIILGDLVVLDDLNICIHSTSFDYLHSNERECKTNIQINFIIYNHAQ